MEDLEKTLFQFGLVDKVFTEKELLSLASSGEKVPIMMGQTFDDGQPVDMIKYGLFIMELEDYFKKAGANHSSQWVLADHFMTAINKEKELPDSLIQRDSRQEFLNKINNTYNGKIGVVYSSDLTSKNEYKQILIHLQQELERSPKFREEMLSSIPSDRRQNPGALRYPLEELATIFSLGTKVKIGPRYEISYDLPARDAAHELGFERYVAIHLTHSFPLGDPTIPREDRIEIDSFGLTPYKINSKKLRRCRLDPINGDPSEEKALILQTQDLRPIKDLIAFSLLARKRLLGENNSEVLVNLHDFRDARVIAYELYDKYIKKPLMGAK
jgi:hypothetical protein